MFTLLNEIIAKAGKAAHADSVDWCNKVDYVVVDIHRITGQTRDSLYLSFTITRPSLSIINF